MRIEVIVNCSSGAGHDDGVRQRLEQAFQANGATARISTVESGAAVVTRAREIAGGDADMIVAAGGDGTVASIASVVVESGKLMGVLPFGTLSHFAKDLEIPLDLDAAVAAIVTGREIRVDVGTVNGRTFINNSSLGLYPSIVHERERQERLGRGKWPAFVLAALAVLRRYPFLDVRVGVEGRELYTRTPFVFIGNNEYEMALLTIGRRASLDKGELSLYLPNRTGRLGLVRLAFRALFGGLDQEKDFLKACTREIRIDAKHKRPIRVALDGEVLLMELPLSFVVRPQALRVIAGGEETES
jgi:diacylglycerol kinase family enzyme